VTKLDQLFYERSANDVARDLIGAIIVRMVGQKKFRARIVETEAYIGAHDLASHASKGRTNRTDVMFGPAGRAYIYLVYGLYEMFNVVTAAADDPQTVLIRAAEPLDGWQADLSGPGKLTRGLCITRAANGQALTGSRLYLMRAESVCLRVDTTPRVGVEYAKEWKDQLLRFVDPASEALSGRD
jgi:DNA-3-methyladenine glycosylase